MKNPVKRKEVRYNFPRFEGVCMCVCVCVCVELFRLVVYVDRYAITILRAHIKAEDEQDS